MKILMDTNVILDIAINREPFVKESIECLTLCEIKNWELYISGSSVTDIFYVLRKKEGRDTARNFLQDLLEIILICKVDREVIFAALESGFQDFEDAVQHFSATHSDMDIILTRNPKDFQKSELEIFTPTHFLQEYS